MRDRSSSSFESSPPPDATTPDERRDLVPARLAPDNLRDALNELGLRPSRRLGQNFLVDRSVVRRMAAAADLEAVAAVLEIGPGLGVLTEELVRYAHRVVAVELDRRLADRLQTIASAESRLEVVNEDVLQLNLCAYFERRAYHVVANLPYAVTSPTLRHLLESPCPPAKLVVMVQREVAQRIVAGPGELSLLGLAVQFYGRPRILFRVSAGAFRPRPKVESAVVRVDLYEQRPLQVAATAFFATARAGFAQPRKQLHNNLTGRLGLEPGRSQELLRRAGLDPQRRPATLSLPEWGHLAEMLANAGVLPATGVAVDEPDAGTD